MPTSLHSGSLPGQAIDFKRVARFAETWRDDPGLDAPARAMAEDLAWGAAHIQQSAAPDLSDGSAIRAMTCHLCRLRSANKLPPCRSEDCALHGIP